MERAPARERSAEVAGEPTDAALLAVKKLIAAFLQEGSGSTLGGAVEQALLRLAQAPTRERADYLLSLLGQPEIATPSGHPLIRRSAVRALVEMGYPYALEVPPEALAELPRRRSGRARRIVAASLLVPVWLASAIGTTVFWVLFGGGQWFPLWLGLGSTVLVHLALGTSALGLLRRRGVARNRWLLFGASLGAFLVAVDGPRLTAFAGVAGLLALAISPSGESAENS